MSLCTLPKAFLYLLPIIASQVSVCVSSGNAPTLLSSPSQIMYVSRLEVAIGGDSHAEHIYDHSQHPIAVLLISAYKTYNGVLGELFRIVMINNLDVQ
jgi:hypothetical protein